MYSGLHKFAKNLQVAFRKVYWRIRHKRVATVLLEFYGAAAESSLSIEIPPTTLVHDYNMGLWLTPTQLAQPHTIGPNQTTIQIDAHHKYFSQSWTFFVIRVVYVKIQILFIFMFVSA